MENSYGDWIAENSSCGRFSHVHGYLDTYKRDTSPNWLNFFIPWRFIPVISPVPSLKVIKVCRNPFQIGASPASRARIASYVNDYSNIRSRAPTPVRSLGESGETFEGRKKMQFREKGWARNRTTFTGLLLCVFTLGSSDRSKDSQNPRIFDIFVRCVWMDRGSLSIWRLGNFLAGFSQSLHLHCHAE